MSRDMEIDRRARLRSALVKAGREERASDSLRASLRAVAAATVAAPVAIAAASSDTVSVAKAATAKAVTSGAPGSASTAAVAASAKGTAVWKLLAALLAIGAAGASATVFASRAGAPAASPAPPMNTARVVAVAPTAAVTTTPAPAPEEIASMSVDDLPTVKAAPSGRIAPRAPSSELAAPAARPSTAARLTEETRAIGAIRASVQRGDTREALHLLDSYEAEFPRGVLAEEAEVLRIETLGRAGDKAEAARRASRFLAERPSSRTQRGFEP